MAGWPNGHPATVFATFRIDVARGILSPVLKVAFWGLVALDALGIALLFLLGLAAAGSARSNPLQVTLLLLVLPCLPLAAAVLVFNLATASGWRIAAFLLAAAPLLIAGSTRALAEVRFRSSLNAAGEMTYFRAGPMREAAEAIERNDARAVTNLLSTIDVNRTGTDGMTLLGLAMRQLRETPQQHDVLRVLLAAGADPDHEVQYELPLSVAIQVADRAGPNPVRQLLDAGADPNRAGALGIPVFFGATGRSATPELLALLIDRGADVNAVARNGQTALFSAAATRNWAAALLLLERGADWRKGRSVNGLGFRELIDSYSGAEQGDSAYVLVRRFLQQPSDR